METVTINAEDIKKLLKNKEYTKLKNYLQNTHPYDIAEALSELNEKNIWEILKLIELPLAAEIFSYLDLDIQLKVVEITSRNELAQLISEMPNDDRVDLLKKMPEDYQKYLLPAIAQAEREDIIRLSSYEEGTAGAVMTSEYVTLQPHITVAQAIEKLRLEAPDKETIYYAYVVDKQRKLLGFVSLKDLILADPKLQISQIMQKDIIYAKVNDDQEEAARKIQKYNLIALPVINENDALVGIITYDDAMDIITQEQTEDMEKLMAIGGSHEASYIKTPVWIHFKNRAGWIIGLAALGLFSGMIIQSFEDTMKKLMILALYMPMIADTGGNIGSQSATVIIRALALGEIKLKLKEMATVLLKEFKISLLLAIVLGILSWAKVVFISKDATIPAGYTLLNISIVIALALSLQVITSTLIGTFLPLIAAKFKLDPAVVASPALTTIVDITGLFIYFTTAKLLLHI